VFTFANAPTITGVSLDPRSSSGYTPALSFNGNQIFVNEAGLTLTSTTMGLFAVTTATAPPPVPEAESYAMLLAGLGLLGWTARRRRG
jgi:MYXO-CTERM domain-containing protein